VCELEALLSSVGVAVLLGVGGGVMVSVTVFDSDTVETADKVA
jgi:hypothetical protein